MYTSAGLCPDEVQIQWKREMLYIICMRNETKTSPFGNLGKIRYILHVQEDGENR